MDIVYIKRLAFIKYLYKTGEEQSKRPEPLSSSSLLSFHDSIELFLQLSYEFLNGNKKVNDLMEYFEAIKLCDKELSYKEPIRKLNKARVNLKHFGNFPSQLDVEYFKELTGNFLKENCLKIFNENFEDISLINMIPSTEVQKLLNNAIENLGLNKYESLKNISISFAKVLTEYEKKLFYKYGSFNNVFSKNFHSYQHFYTGNEVSIGELQNKINLITDALLIFSLGIDYNKYIKFTVISFYVYQTRGGGCHVEPREAIESKLGRTIEELYSEDDIKFCLDFVIESSLLIYSKDFNFSSLHLV